MNKRIKHLISAVIALLALTLFLTAIIVFGSFTNGTEQPNEEQVHQELSDEQ